MDVRAVRHLHHAIMHRVCNLEAKGLADHLQHLVDRDAVVAGHGGGVLVRNLESFVVGVRDLKRDSCVAVVLVFWWSCLSMFECVWAGIKVSHDWSVSVWLNIQSPASRPITVGFWNVATPTTASSTRYNRFRPNQTKWTFEAIVQISNRDIVTSLSFRHFSVILQPDLTAPAGQTIKW